MNIGLFGGTFDPIHNGHIGLAEAIVDRKLLNKIIFIPAAQPPHKPKIPVTPFFHRANMIKLAIGEKPYFEMSEIEEERLSVPSYTCNTIRWFSSTYPNDKFYLIIGEDSLAQIHTWHKAKKIIDTYEIITYPRTGENITLEKLKKHWSSETAQRLFRTILSLPVHDVSATKIRMSIKREENLRSLVPLTVYEYIKKHVLYRKA